MTPEQEYEFYAEPENQEPQGPARRRRAPRLGPPVPVRFPSELPRPESELEQLAEHYGAHDTSTEMEHGEWVE